MGSFSFWIFGDKNGVEVPNYIIFVSQMCQIERMAEFYRKVFISHDKETGTPNGIGSLNNHNTINLRVSQNHQNLIYHIRRVLFLKSVE